MCIRDRSSFASWLVPRARTTIAPPAGLSERGIQDEIKHDGHDADDHRRPDGGPKERVNLKMARQGVGDLEQESIHDDAEQAERQQLQGKREDAQYGPDESVDQTKDHGGLWG